MLVVLFDRALGSCPYNCSGVDWKVDRLCNCGTKSNPRPCPELVPGEDEKCELRRKGRGYNGGVCKRGGTPAIRFQVSNDIGMADPNVNVFLFNSLAERENWRQCRTFDPYMSFMSRSCIEPRTVISNTPDLYLVISCLDPNGCSLNFGLQYSCTFRNTGAPALGVAGMTLCSMSMFTGVALFVFVIFVRKMPRVLLMAFWEITMPLALLTANSTLNAIFWLFFYLDASYDEVDWTFAQDVYYPACWWIDKLSLLLAVVTLVHVLYPFVISFHDERHHRRIRFGQVLLLAGLGIIWVVTTAVAWSRVGLPSLASAAPVTAFYVLFFLAHLSLCVSLLVYGILLIRKSSKRELRGAVLRLVLFVGVLILFNVVRIAFSSYVWIENLSMRKAGDDSYVFYPGFRVQV